MKTIYVSLPQSETPYITVLLKELQSHYLFIFDRNIEFSDKHILMKFSEPQGLFGQSFEIQFFPKEALSVKNAIITIGQSFLTDVKNIKNILEFLTCDNQQMQQKMQNETTNIQVVAIAASTGGPQALMEMLPTISDLVRVPIFLTQHMQGNLLNAFYHQLKELLPHRNVYLAEDGMKIKPMSLYIAPGDRHLIIKKTDHLFCSLSNGPLINYVKPAADPMFQSIADVYPTGSVLGVVLTGMGQDGLEGCKSIIEKKGMIIAQDEASSVVWGMPKAVVEANLAYYVLPLQRIGKIIGSVCQHSFSREGRHE